MMKMLYGVLAMELCHSMYVLGQMYINEGYGLHPFLGGMVGTSLIAVGIAWCYADRKESYDV